MEETPKHQFPPGTVILEGPVFDTVYELMTAGEQRVLPVIMHHLPDAWPKIDTIAKTANMCRSTAMQAVSDLEAHGFILVTRKYGFTNHYTVANLRDAGVLAGIKDRLIIAKQSEIQTRLKSRPVWNSDSYQSEIQTPTSLKSNHEDRSREDRSIEDRSREGATPPVLATLASSLLAVDINRISTAEVTSMTSSPAQSSPCEAIPTAESTDVEPLPAGMVITEGTRVVSSTVIPTTPAPCPSGAGVEGKGGKGKGKRGKRGKGPAKSAKAPKRPAMTGAQKDKGLRLACQSPEAMKAYVQYGSWALIDPAAPKVSQAANWEAAGTSQEWSIDAWCGWWIYGVSFVSQADGNEIRHPVSWSDTRKHIAKLLDELGPDRLQSRLTALAEQWRAITKACEWMTRPSPNFPNPRPWPALVDAVCRPEIVKRAADYEASSAPQPTTQPDNLDLNDFFN